MTIFGSFRIGMSPSLSHNIFGDTTHNTKNAVWLLPTLLDSVSVSVRSKVNAMLIITAQKTCDLSLEAASSPGIIYHV